MQPEPKSLREVKEKRNDFLRALANGRREKESLLALPGARPEDDCTELIAFGVQVLTWVLSEDHLPQSKWNTDAGIPVGTWRTFEEPEDPLGLRVVSE